MNAEQFAIDLANCETDSEIIKLLQKNNLWDNEKNWRPFGDNDNNYSIIGNQQSSADTALVEKIINSVDANLMKECLAKGINPEGPDAPQNIRQAVHDFYGVQDGSLTRLSPSERNQLSQNIILASSGAKKGAVNYTLVDQGEGQTPARMPQTILSISRNNKLKIPFVQGKFNMGGTGALTFSGKNGFNVIISKRCPDIPNFSNDPTYSHWSVTLIRKEPPRDGRKSSMYTYLTDNNGNLFQFSAKSLPIIPAPYGRPKSNMFYGTFIKLFDYALHGYKSMSTTDLYYRLNTLIPTSALPIRIVETREYKGHSFETTLSGLNVRLAEDKSENLEPGFPISSEFTVEGQNFKCQIYLFKKKKDSSDSTSRNYRRKDGIIYTVNGQTHATDGEGFFAQQKVGLSYLQDSLLVVVDCSELDIAHSEELFMTSRDRMRKSQFSGKIKESIAEILKNNSGIKEAANKRKEELTRNKLTDDQPFRDVLQDVFRASPVLSQLLIAGTEVQAPFNTSAHSNESEPFIGRLHPTFFTLRKGKNNKLFQKQVPINQGVYRVQFHTDAVNDYFGRDIDPGQLKVYRESDGEQVSPEIVNVYNGIVTLTFRIPNGCKIGDKDTYRVEVHDPFKLEPFVNRFEYLIDKEREENKTRSSGKRKSAPGSGNGNEPSRGLAIPEMIEVTADEWDVYDMNSKSGVIIREDETGTQMFINIDNKYLQSELKGIRRDKSKIDLLKAKYRYGMALVTMAVQSHYLNDDETDIYKEVAVTTELIAPILIPLLNSVASIEI